MPYITVNVETEKLVPGQVLAEDIRDPNGLPLLYKGVTLSQGLINGLRNREYIGSVKIYVSVEKAPEGLIKPGGSDNFPIPGGVQTKIKRFFEKARTMHELSSSTVQHLTNDVQPIIEAIFETKPSVIDSLQLISNYDDHTHNHSWMVMMLALSVLRIAELDGLFGKGPDRQDKLDIAIGGLLHDIGKTKIPLEILNKPGRLTSEEWKIMKKHPDYGYAMVKRTENLMPISKAIVAHHHRFMDGTGYSPANLPVLKKVPDHIRIVTLVDAYEAIVSDRPYHMAALPYHAIRILEQGAGTKFDPRFLICLKEMVAPFPTGSFILFQGGLVALVESVDPLQKRAPFLKIIAGLQREAGALVGRKFQLGDNLPGVPKEKHIILGAYSPTGLAEKVTGAMNIGRGLDVILGSGAIPYLTALPKWEEIITNNFSFLLRSSSEKNLVL